MGMTQHGADPHKLWLYDFVSTRVATCADCVSIQSRTRAGYPVHWHKRTWPRWDMERVVPLRMVLARDVDSIRGLFCETLLELVRSPDFEKPRRMP